MSEGLRRGESFPLSHPLSYTSELSWILIPWEIFSSIYDSGRSAQVSPTTNSTYNWYKKFPTRRSGPVAFHSL